MVVCGKCGNAKQYTGIGWVCFSGRCQREATHSGGAESLLVRQLLETERERVKVLESELAKLENVSCLSVVFSVL